MNGNNYNNGFNTNMNNQPNNLNNNAYNNYNQQPVPTPQMQEQMNNQNSLAQGGTLYDFSSDLQQPQSNGYSNENAVYKSDKKGGGGFFAFLEFLIIVFLCLYIANDKGYIHIEFLDNLIPAKEVNKNNATDDKTDKKEKTNEETEVKDEKITTEYTNKSAYIANIGVSFNNLISHVFTKDTKVEELTDTDKLTSVAMGLYYVDKAFKNVESDEEFKAVFPNEDLTKKSTFLYVDATSFENKYKTIFGGTAPKSTSGLCPSIIYNDTYKKYYLNPNCNGENNGLSFKNYIYKITSIEDKYNVYMAISTSRANGEGTVTVYKDAKQESTYKVFTNSEYPSFKLSNDNYKEFDCYKVTFQKNGDDFLFKEITKVTETDAA